MAVCNLFNTLSNNSGNFLMFSQYVEDITKNYTNGNNWKVIPTKFIALNIDYSSVNKALIAPDDTDLNIAIAKYFQNCFENPCAYDRNMNTETWNPKVSKNIFWNSMFKSGLLTIQEDSNEEDSYYIPQVMYYNDINMHSYNEHQGMGYSEIYCYIPSDAKKIKCHILEQIPEKQYTNTANYLEGFKDATDNNLMLGSYSTQYCKDDCYLMSFDSQDVNLAGSNLDDKSYNINTIVVLYSIFNKVNDEWLPVYEYSNIPMGIYFAGKFNGTDLSNQITKYVTTSYDSGTSYGLRICTRFSATSNGRIINTDVTTDDSDYTNICQMMTAMNENLTKMLDVTKSAISTSQEYKESLATIKNSKTNVPYVKSIGGEDFWFVNGKPVTPTKVVSLQGIDEEYINKLNYSFSWNKSRN